MPEWLPGAVILYLFIAFIFLIFSLGTMPSRSVYYQQRRKLHARIGLTFLIWPLWIPALILWALTYGVYRFIQIARTGK